jgi:membrane-bound serine protease (ClpP class)
MDAFVLIAVIAVVLMLAELLLPTGGLLAGLGAIGLIVAGIVALTADADTAATEYVGPALITVGILSGITFYFVTRKVLEAHRETDVRTGSEEMIGSVAEVRNTLDPEGQVWSGGTLWSARLADGAAPARPGDRVVIEAVDGLTLVVRPEQPAAQTAEQGAS